MLRLGYDAKRLFNNFTGLGNYSRTLLRNLSTYFPDNAYFLYTPRVTRNEETSFFLNSAMFTVQIPEGRLPGAYWRTFGVKKPLLKHKVQLYHGLSHEIPLNLPKTGIKSIVTIHDLIFRHYPEQYPWIDRQVYDFKFDYACKNADRIVAISQSTKQDIVEYYGIAPEKIRVIYQSCHERFMTDKPAGQIEAILEKYQLPHDYLLYVGSLIERKNLLGIVKALELLPDDLKLPLVVVGRGDAYKKKVMEYVLDRKLDNWLLFLNPEFDDLPALYQQAHIFLYPSFYEGFGIPIIEALFSGTPVIASNRSSLPEAAGSDAWLADPSCPEMIAEGIRRILTDEDLRNRMIKAGFEYARRFRGEQLTQQMMDLYLEVLGVENIQSGRIV